MRAKAADVGDRVRFQVVDASRELPGEFDVVHDVVDPRGLLRSIRAALAATRASSQTAPTGSRRCTGRRARCSDGCPLSLRRPPHGAGEPTRTGRMAGRLMS